MEHDLQQQVAELLAHLVDVVEVEGVQRLMRFFEQITSQGLMRLLAVPRAALGRAQVRDRLLERLERRAARQRRHVERSQMRDVRAAVDLIELERLDHRFGCAGAMDELHGMLVGILIHQRQLDLAGDVGRVHLRDERRQIGVEVGMMQRADVDAVDDLQAGQRIDAERGQRRLDERQPGDDAQLEAALGRPGLDQLHGALGHQRVPGHGVDDAFRPRAQLEDAFADGAIDLSEVRRGLVHVIEAMDDDRPRQARQRGMARRAHPHLGRGGQRVPGRARQIAGIARPKPYDRDDAHGVEFTR